MPAAGLVDLDTGNVRVCVCVCVCVSPVLKLKDCKSLERTSLARAMG